MQYFANGQELHDELAAALDAFFASPDGELARERVRDLADSAILTLHVVEPEATITIDFLAGSVSSAHHADADVEIQLEADALHDVLLERLDPVQISRLYETDLLAFSGEARNLAGLITLAGPLSRFYTESLERRGRDDLLTTPLPETKVAWLDEGPYREVIGKRRPWQRAKAAPG